MEIECRKSPAGAKHLTLRGFPQDFGRNDGTQLEAVLPDVVPHQYQVVV